jgi:IclR family transcriptional regulator, acetate operon repressor
VSEQPVPIPSAEAPAYPIGSVDSALRLLLMFGERSEVRIADAAKELGVARSTAHRLMQMLQFYGFVRQDPTTRAYTAGPVWVNLGLQGVRNLDIRTVARPHLEALVEETKETVQLLALQPNGQLICLDAVESSYVVRAAGRVGVALPSHATAGGRALLAHMTPERLSALFPGTRLPRVGPRTLVTRAALDAELQRVRKQGYAAQRDEMEDGVSAIAAPIRDPRGGANFSIDVVMPTSRLADADVPRIGAAAIACADRIATELSW